MLGMYMRYGNFPADRSSQRQNVQESFEKLEGGKVQEKG